MIKILIADDHKLFTDGLSALLSTVPEILLVGTVKNGKELIHWFNHQQAAIALIDLNMPEMDGIEASKHLLKYFPQTRIIILSTYLNNNLMIDLKKMGVAGYLKKDCDFMLLLDTIKKVAAGGFVFEDFMKKGAAPAFSVKDEFLNKHRLSSREVEILSLIRRGFSTKEIAEHLFISVLTVSTHRKNICHKLNIKTSAGLTRFAIDNRL